MRFLTQNQKDFFEKNGYLLVPKLFSMEEVENYRKGCRLNKPGDSTCRPEFGNVMLSPKVVSIIKDLLGDEIIYPGLSLTRTDDFPKPFGSRFFHTDTIDEDGDFETDYSVINTGIYLQDYVNFSGTLKIMPGSHKRACITSTTIIGALKNIVKQLLKGNIKGAIGILNLHRSVNIPTMPGDMIIWYVRTHHSGYGIRPKFLHNWSLPPVIENWIPEFLKLPDNPERNVILSIFAAKNKYLETYIKKQISKGYRKEHYLNNACLDTIKIEGVTVRNDGYHYVKDGTNTFSKEAEYV
jgi:hypothetical protein